MQVSQRVPECKNKEQQPGGTNPQLQPRQQKKRKTQHSGN